MQPIRCHSCLQQGHTALFSRAAFLTGRRDSTGLGNGRVTAPSKNRAGHGSTGIGPSPQPPPIPPLEPGTELSLNRAWAAKGKAIATNDPRPNTIHLPRSVATPPPLSRPDPSPSTLLVSSFATTPENPSQPLFTPPGGATEVPSPSFMAFQRADPRPFIPNTFQWVDIPNREFVSRAVAPVRPPANNEDLAIVTFNPLPGNALSFNQVRNTVRDCLVQLRVVPRGIYPCHLGQAFVRFHHAYERDNLVLQSPLDFGHVQLSFIKHNEGRNWRRVEYNEECWMMLLGMPNDYKTERHIYNAVSDFSRMILWEESDDFPGRILVRARVQSVESVPQFIVYSDPWNPNGHSWTVQCEVVQHMQQGQQPPEEDPVPNELELEAFVPYDFFGYGQPVAQQEQIHIQEEQEQDMQQQQQGNQNFQVQAVLNLPNQDQQQVQGGQVELQLQQANPWEPWAPWPQQPAQQANLPNPQQANPQQALAQQQQQQQGHHFNLNEPPLQNQQGIDLNLDPIEVIINPVNPQVQQEQLDNPVQEEEQVIPQPIQVAQHQQNQPVPQPNLPQNHNVAVEGDFMQWGHLPQLPDLIGEEIPMDQLVDQMFEDLPMLDPLQEGGHDNLNMDLDQVLEQLPLGPLPQQDLQPQEVQHEP